MTIWKLRVKLWINFLLFKAENSSWLEGRAGRSFMESDKGKVLHLGWASVLGRSSARKDLGDSR